MKQNEQAIKALQELVTAANKLSLEWNESLNAAYPFEKDFQEIVNDLISWYLTTARNNGGVRQRLLINYGIVLTGDTLRYTDNKGEQITFTFFQLGDTYQLTQAVPGRPFIIHEVTDIDKWLRSHIRQAIRDMNGGYKHAHKTAL